MTDAPERIFVDYGEHTDTYEQVSDSPYEGTEYTRADITDAIIAELEAEYLDSLIENARLREALRAMKKPPQTIHGIISIPKETDQ